MILPLFLHEYETTDQIFFFRQIPDKSLEYNETVHQLSINFKEASDPLWIAVLYDILIDFGVPMKLVRLIK
jgi:hypothetical protein